MQPLSAANLLIASQQQSASKPAPGPKPAQAFASALKEAGPAEGAGFEPLQFRSAPKPEAEPRPSSPPASFPGAAILGSNVDIRV